MSTPLPFPRARTVWNIVRRLTSCKQSKLSFSRRGDADQCGEMRSEQYDDRKNSRRACEISGSKAAGQIFMSIALNAIRFCGH
jgi:hypothetical protein